MTLPSDTVLPVLQSICSIQVKAAARHGISYLWCLVCGVYPDADQLVPCTD